MATIHQILATHCTYGTSALERAEGELSERPLGYGPRASSLSKTELSRQFRFVQRYLYYYLSKDFTKEQLETLLPEEAPRRLVFVPSASGCQFLEQISYRQRAVDGRVGSYFAHILLADRSLEEPGWSVLDCIQLWGAAGWQDTDIPSRDFDMQALSSLAGLRHGEPARIDDEMLVSFLSVPDRKDFPPALERLLPERWLTASLQQRETMFRLVMRGFLESSYQHKSSLVLVCEPSAAVLLFYGIARLLPSSPLRQNISFSTFESSPEHVCTALAAVSFQDMTLDLPANQYMRNVVIHTQNSKHSQFRHGELKYADRVVDLLLAKGWPAVDSLLSDFAATGAANASELNELLVCEELAERFINPQPVEPAIVIQGERQRKYVARRLHAYFGTPASDSRVAAWVKSPPHCLAALGLMRIEGESGVLADNVQRLTAALPADCLLTILSLEALPILHRHRLFSRYMAETKCLPKGSENWWREGNNPRQPLANTLIPRFLADADEALLQAIWEKLEPRDQVAFVRQLFLASEKDLQKQHFVADLAKTLSDPQVEELLSTLPRELHTTYLPLVEHVQRRMIRLLRKLPADLQHFRQRLEFLERHKAFIREPGCAGQLKAWLIMRDLLRSGPQAASTLDEPSLWQRLTGSDQARSRTSAAEDLCVNLAAALAQAVPLHSSNLSESTIRERALLIKSIAGQFGIPAEVLPTDFSEGMHYCLKHGCWPQPAQVFRAREPEGQSPLDYIQSDRGFLIGSIALVAILVVAFSLWTSWDRISSIVARLLPTGTQATEPNKNDPTGPIEGVISVPAKVSPSSKSNPGQQPEVKRNPTAAPNGSFPPNPTAPNAPLSPAPALPKPEKPTPIEKDLILGPGTTVAPAPPPAITPPIVTSDSSTPTSPPASNNSTATTEPKPVAPLEVSEPHSPGLCPLAIPGRERASAKDQNGKPKSPRVTVEWKTGPTTSPFTVDRVTHKTSTSTFSIKKDPAQPDALWIITQGKKDKDIGFFKFSSSDFSITMPNNSRKDDLSQAVFVLSTGQPGKKKQMFLDGALLSPSRLTTLTITDGWADIPELSGDTELYLARAKVFFNTEQSIDLGNYSTPSKQKLLSAPPQVLAGVNLRQLSVSLEPSRRKWAIRIDHEPLMSSPPGTAVPKTIPLKIGVSLFRVEKFDLSDTKELGYVVIDFD